MAALIVFDFDGTVIYSLEIFIEATNRLAEDFCYSPLSFAQMPSFRKLSLREMIGQLGMPKWKFPFFIRRFRKELSGLMADARFVNGMKQALFNIYQEHYRLGIVTSNSRQNVEFFLDLHEVRHLFDFIYGGQVLSGKTQVLKKISKRNKSTSQSLVYVGDETSDIQAAKCVGLPNIAVGWGFNNQEILSASNPDILIDNPSQLLAAITQLCRV